MNKSIVSGGIENTEIEILLNNFLDDLVKPIISNLRKFLGDRKMLKFKIKKKINTFAFSLSDEIIYVPFEWINKYYTLTKNGDEYGKYTNEFLVFAMYHECAHFRDLLIERDLKKSTSILNTYKRIGKESIKYNDGKKSIPIGGNIHVLYNCIEDVVVNKEVEYFLINNIDKELLKYIYKNLAFPNFVKKEGGEYNEKEEYVGEGNGNYTIDNYGDVDYSKLSFSQAFPFFLLRNNMVKDQNIILPSELESIFIMNDKKSSNPINQSISSLIELMESVKNKQLNSKNYQNISDEYDTQIIKLKLLLNVHLKKDGEVYNILRVLSQKVRGFSNKYSFFSLSINDLVEIFTYSHGVGNSHALDILPAERYKIIQEIIEPIQKSLILIDIVNGKDLEEKEENNEKEQENSEEEENNTQEGNNNVRGKRDEISEKIRILEELKEEIINDELEKEKEKRKYEVISVFDKSDVGEFSKKIVNDIKIKYKKRIEELMDFINNELRYIDYVIKENYELSKNGKLDYGRLGKILSSDPQGLKIRNHTIYNRKETKEKISDNYKKLDITMLIDISGSMECLKGKDGILNVLVVVLSQTFFLLEKQLQNLFEDENYKIDINFILYHSKIGYCSFDDENFGKIKEPVKLVRVIEEIINKSGGTNDEVAWKLVSNKMKDVLLENQGKIIEIENNQRKSIVLQIADEDVSQSGVDYLNTILSTYPFSQKVRKGFAIKRVVFGYKEDVELSPQEYEKRMHGGYWEKIEKTSLGNYRLREVHIKSKKQLLDQIKKLLKNMFDDITNDLL